MATKSLLVRRVTNHLLERYPGSFSTDYYENRRILDTMVALSSRKLRNTIAGCITHRMRMERVPRRRTGGRVAAEITA